MKSIFLTLFLVLTGMILLGQAADPELTTPGISPSPGFMGDPTEATVTFQNEVPTAIPHNELDPTQIVITLNKIQPDFIEGELVVDVTNGPSWFTWSAECSSGCGTSSAIWVITGTQNQEIPAQTSPFEANSQTFTFPGIVTSESSPEEALAFNGHGFNANIIPCAFHGDCDAENGPESNNQSIYTYTEIILPVELSEFIAEKKGSETYLQWTTATEVNNDFFEVQHSTDGSAWTILDIVVGNGTTQEESNYSYIHSNPSVGVNYYRLNQVDYNGSSEFSEVRMVRFENDTPELIVSYFPNPTSDILNITTNQTVEGYKYYIYDFSGKLLMQKDFHQKTTMSLEGLEGGIYLARLVDKGNRVISTQKIIKL